MLGDFGKREKNKCFKRNQMKNISGEYIWVISLFIVEANHPDQNLEALMKTFNIFFLISWYFVKLLIHVCLRKPWKVMGQTY